MPATRQRKTNKPKEEGGRDRQESEGSNHGLQHQQHYQNRQKAMKKGGVSWKPVLKTLAYFILAIAIPTLLNYAVLNQEARMLVPAGITK